MRTIHRVLERGANLLDTSHSYGEGHNQMLIGRAIKGMRDLRHPFQYGSPPGKPGDRINPGGGREAYLRKTGEESLTWLGIDHLTSSLSRLGRSVPIEESVGAMAKLVQEAKTRYIGFPRFPAPSAARLVHPCVAADRILVVLATRNSLGISTACAKSRDHLTENLGALAVSFGGRRRAHRRNLSRRGSRVTRYPKDQMARVYL